MSATGAPADAAVPAEGTPVDVSVVVPVGTVDATTGTQLAALRALDTSSLAVEVVLSLNSPSADDARHLRDLAAEPSPVPMRIVDSSARRGAAHARNAGAAAAAGRVLAFCDADDVVEPAWLVSLVRGLEHHDAVSGHLEELVEQEAHRGLRPPATPGALPTFLGVPYLLSGNMAIGRELFLRMGGFDTTLVRSEDTAFSWRLLANGCSIGYVADAVVQYRMRAGLVPMLRQQFGYGRGSAQILIRYGIPPVAAPEARGANGQARTGSGGRPVRLLAANAQPGGRGSWVRLVRRASTGLGRAFGIVEEKLWWRGPRTGLQPPVAEAPPVEPEPLPAGAKVVFVADAGGHLLEGWIMRELLYPQAEITWYTADTVMSRSLLRAEPTIFARRRVLPRRPDLAARELLVAVRLLRRLDPDAVVSTGSAVALPWLAAAVLQGRRAVFHESAARLAGLSLTGRLLELVPRVERYTQTPIPRHGWRRSRSTFELADRVRDAQRPAPAPAQPTVLVTVGTYEYAFTRLLRRVEEVVPAGWHVVWQIGHAGGHRPGRGEVHEFMPYQGMLDAMRTADVVITHAGVGSVLAALQAGRLPIVVPRRAHHREVADDHQLEVLPYLRAHGITALDDVDDLTAEVLAGVAAQTTGNPSG